MHDAKGRELKIGDRVVVPFTITSLGNSEDYCNVSLQSTIKMPPENKYTTDLGAINTKQVFRANAGDDPNLD